MAADPTTRGTARLAAAIAVPVALVAGLLAYAILGGFHGRSHAPSAGATASPVEMAAPALPAADAQMCLAFIAALPVSLGGLPERHVTAGAQQNAAFGDPPITVACGAPKAAYAPTDEVFVLSGVCWHEVSGHNSTVWTTLDRKVPVAVTVPSKYRQPAQWTILFANPLIAAMPSISSVPSGCRP